MYLQYCSAEIMLNKQFTNPLIFVTSLLTFLRFVPKLLCKLVSKVVAVFVVGKWWRVDFEGDASKDNINSNITYAKS